MVAVRWLFHSKSSWMLESSFVFLFDIDSSICSSSWDSRSWMMRHFSIFLVHNPVLKLRNAVSNPVSVNKWWFTSISLAILIIRSSYADARSKNPSSFQSWSWSVNDFVSTVCNSNFFEEWDGGKKSLLHFQLPVTLKHKAGKEKKRRPEKRPACVSRSYRSWSWSVTRSGRNCHPISS